MKQGIYIHIPFCKQACSYCNFFFSTRQHYIPDFVNRLKAEIEQLPSQLTQHPPETLYFGGGTPSLIPLEDFSGIIKTLNNRFDLTGLQETTLEVNPDDITAEKLDYWLELGITRLSVGVQSFDENLLRFMHRAHDRATAESALKMIKSAGFTNFSVDIIYGNPGQTTEMLALDIDRFLDFDPPHISAYALTIEPKTRLGKMEELGRLTQADEETVIAHSELLQQKLEDAGLERYEISNYARPGFRAVHNSNYWVHQPYIGLGPGAHGFRWDKDKKSGIRTIRRPDLKSYINEGFTSTEETEELCLKTLAEERFMTGLRISEGVSLSELEHRYCYRFNQRQLSMLSEFERQGWIQSRDPLQLSREGWHRADRITLELLAAG